MPARKKIAFAATVLAMCGLSSSARALITESEPNSTTRTASLITRTAETPFSDVGVASLARNDIDIFQIDLNAGEVLTFNAVGLNIVSGLSSPNTYIALTEGDGLGGNKTLLAVNDDVSPTDVGSAIHYPITESGIYYLSVTGTGFAGTTHNELGDYAITVSIVQEPSPTPEPSSLGLLLTAGTMLLRRRGQMPV